MTIEPSRMPRPDGSAESDNVGIAGDEADRLDGHAEPLGDQLRETRLMTLTRKPRR